MSVYKEASIQTVKNNPKVLIVGCGKIGSQLADVLANDVFDVTGLKRSLPDIPAQNWHYHIADISVKDSLQGLAKNFQFVFFIVSPAHRSVEGYEKVYQLGLSNLINYFADNEKQPHWFFVSSSSVYGQSQGEWVDEDSLTEPESATAKIILAAEKLLSVSKVSSTVVRFSGIYGIDRLRLINQAKKLPEIQCSPPYYTNRIHEKDCIAVLRFLLLKQMQGVNLQPCYLVTDDTPVSKWEIMTWIAEQMHLPNPTKLQQKTHVAMNKRCSNQRIKALGYQLLYPDYKKGYREIITEHQV